MRRPGTAGCATRFGHYGYGQGLRCQAVILSAEAKKRLRWFEHFDGNGRNASRTCRYFGISRQTFYRWKRRYDRHALATLEKRSSRPRRVRRPQWTHEQVMAVLELRAEFPRWGKYKLQVLLRKRGVELSASTVGRILRELKARGRLVEQKKGARPFARARRIARPYAVRKPREYAVKQPGDLVQLDTMDLRPVPGTSLKQFTARDVISRWDVLGCAERATAITAQRFLGEVLERMPFKVRAVQIDGGSEFKADFELACKARRLKLFVLPPRSPKLNGHVERSNGSHRHEFHEVYELPHTVDAMTRELRRWENVYNTVRPHQALGYLTPREFLRQLPKRASGP